MTLTKEIKKMLDEDTVYKVLKKIDGQYRSIFVNINDAFSAAYEDALKHEKCYEQRYIIVFSRIRKTFKVLVSNDSHFTEHNYRNESIQERYLVGFDSPLLLAQCHFFLQSSNDVPKILTRMIERVKVYDL